jgi:cyclopropane-fatty-acyl-phospholipid synthase
MPDDQKRLAAARRLAGHLYEQLELEFGIRLWDGSVIPQGWNGLTLCLNDPRVLTSAIRQRSLDVLIEAWSTKRLDLEGGSLFDLAQKRPSIKTRDIPKRLDKMLLVRCLLPFVFGERAPGIGKATTRQAMSGREENRSDMRRRRENRRNIAYHYDVSNAFYRLFLDERMVYSCGYFTDWGNDIDQAQADKLDMICRKLRLKPGDRFLDIGCGWGALVIHAAKNYGVTAHGVTLSENQLSLARERIAEAGLADRITLDLTDFSQLDGDYDKIASIGMFEHVGLDNHEAYFKAVARLLRPRGLYLHHAIARRGKADDRTFRRKRPEYQSMVRYIFPGGEVDHPGMTIRNLEMHGFEVHDLEAWREHYARTTRLWAERLAGRNDEAIAEAGEEITRLWLAYLTGVTLAFQRGTLAIYQTLASKRQRGPSGLPPTRADLYR